MKKEVYVAIFLVTFSVAYIFLMSTLERPVYLSEPECGGVVGQVILRLSGSSGTNAHAEIASGTNYIENICYNEIFGKKYTVTNPTICDGKNLVLKLSGQTNAHAELAFGTNYDVNVCYGDIQECQARSGNCIGDERAIVRLSSNTNAHLEKPGLNNYDNVICCKISSPPGPVPPPPGNKACNDKIDNDGDGKIDLIDPGCADINDDDEKDIVPPAGKGRAYWADEKGVEFEKDKNKVNIGDTVILVATGVPANAEVNFVIWDEDLGNLINPDDKIKDGIKAKADDKGVAKFSWKITKEDYDKGGNEADNLELYFIANAGDKDLKSDTLFLGSVPIPPPEEVGCNVYKNELSCKEDKDKQFEKDSLYNTYGCGKTVNKDGKKISTTCACTWENKCILKPRTTTITPHSPGKKPCITECVPEDYKESTCDANSGLKTIDQKMTLQVVAGTDCTKEQIDEEKKQCQDYSASVPCGSKRLQLPLFGFAQFTISLIMISIFYVLIIWRKRVRKEI